MTLTLSLFQRPGSIVFLDDDPDYLETLAMVVPHTWQAELFSRPSGFTERMSQEAARWEADAAAQMQMIERWRQGLPLLPQVLNYWAATPSRYALTKTCVIDYAMPGTNGLQVLNNLVEWPGSTVLLTGQADEQVAVKAFNSGLIDQFIPKQAPDISHQLLDVLRKLALAPHPRLNTLWHSVLQPAQQVLLQLPSVAAALRAYTERHWLEYVLVGEPFGVLGLTADGECHWLQLETTQGLSELAELAGSAGLGFDLMRSIERGQQLAAIELHQQLGLAGPVRTAPTLPMGSDGVLHAANFVLAAADLPQPIVPYSRFLAERDHRIIQDG